MDVTILGAPFNGIGTAPDEENPARAVRAAGLPERLRELGHHVTDLGDLVMPPFSGYRDPGTGVLNQEAWRHLTASLAGALAGRLAPGRPVLLLGGDCSVMSGVVAAGRAAGVRPVVLYVDGHADYRLPRDSPTGEPADLVLPALTGRIPGLFGGAFPHPLAREDEIVVFGCRDLDRIAESRIETFDAARIRRTGLATASREALDRLAAPGAPAWLHFDVDVLDPSVMPAVVFPEDDGLSIAGTEKLLRTAFRTLPVLGMSVACYHPRLDPDGRGAGAIVDLISAVLSA